MRVSEQKRFYDKLREPSAAVIVNGTDRDATFRRNTERVIRLLSDKRDGFGLRVVRLDTTSEVDARARVREQLENGVGLVVVRGGDGTIAPIAHVLSDQQKASDDTPKTQLVVAGGGTENVLRREISRQPDPVLMVKRTIEQGQAIPVDLGVVTTTDTVNGTEVKTPFLVNLEFGSISYCLDVWEQKKRDTGKRKKNRAELVLIYHRRRKLFERFNATVRDEQTGVNESHNNLISLLAVNGGRIGRVNITNSSMRDQTLEGLGLRAGTGWGDIAKIVNHASKGHIPIPDIPTFSMRDAVIEITGGETIVWQHDGDPKTLQVAEGSDKTTFKVTTKQGPELWVPYSSHSPSFRK